MKSIILQKQWGQCSRPLGFDAPCAYLQILSKLVSQKTKLFELGNSPCTPRDAPKKILEVISPLFAEAFGNPLTCR